jgi:sugar lactone lactonase YvrE
MVFKNKIPVKGKKQSLANLPPQGSGASEKGKKTNKIMARILIVIVVLVCVLEAATQMMKQMAKQEIPKLKTELIMKFNPEIKGAGTFVPWGAVAAGRDKVIIADNQNNRLLMFNRKGDFVKSWGTTGKDADQFHEPSGMTTDNQGNAYVVDSWNSAIKGFDEKGKEIANLDLSNQGFFGPRGIGFDGNNFLIADTGSHRIVKVGHEGNVIASWGTVGSGDGHFKGPKAVTSDEKGRYYVADTDNNRLQCLDENGKKIQFIQFNGAVTSVAVDKEGRIYVGTEANDGQVEVLNSNGSALGTLVDQTGSNEPFKGAKFMTITSDDLLLLTRGDAVYLYQLPSFSQKLN